jgi:hypothetical protein
MGDNSIEEAIGKGNMDVTMEIWENIVKGTFINVLHVPIIAKNLFCKIKATSQGHKFEFQNNSCTKEGATKANEILGLVHNDIGD